MKRLLTDLLRDRRGANTLAQQVKKSRAKD